jgi:hypothetical protein
MAVGVPLNWLLSHRMSFWPLVICWRRPPSEFTRQQHLCRGMGVPYSWPNNARLGPFARAALSGAIGEFIAQKCWPYGTPSPTPRRTACCLI